MPEPDQNTIQDGTRAGTGAGTGAGALGDKSVLVIGGGISGISAAAEAAETGCRVYLVEKLPYLGGQVARINEYFPKLCPPYCGLEINFKRIRNNPQIEVLTSSTVEEISGSAGDFTARVRTGPEYVTRNCTACGECTAVCPIETDDPFNYGMTTRKAIALSHELAYPARFHLDDAACDMESCKKCVDACLYNAIQLDAGPKTMEIKVNNIILSTGWRSYDPENLAEFSWGKSPDILTNVMMERLGAPNGPTGGKILKPSDQQPAKKIAFVQCAGSRDENHLPYCSAVCCSASLKQALYFTRQDREYEAEIYYIDLRVTGRNEDFLRKVEENDQIRLVKGKVMAVNMEDGKPVIEAEDILSGRKIKASYDLVILATGIVPEIPVSPGVDLDPDGFIIKESLENGFSAGGCCCEPKDVAATVRESTGIVLNVLQENA
jgi:quinone-modifying oxidoreductase subunit QmoA